MRFELMARRNSPFFLFFIPMCEPARGPVFFCPAGLRERGEFS